MNNTNQFTNLLELQKQFKDEKTCRDYLEKLLWNGKPVCPYCGNEKVYKRKDGKRYQCKECTNNFSVTVGTIFENTKIPLQKWFLAIYIATSHKKGISSCQLARDLGITQKSAWHVLHRIREMLNTNAKEIFTQLVECDSTFLGGKEKNKHKNKKKGGTQGGAGKTVMFGILERGGNVHAEKVKAEDVPFVRPIIDKKVQQGATIVTDENHTYSRLRTNYTHLTVNHSLGEYVKGLASTNGIENFWSVFKRTVAGTYHHISPKHTDRYILESVARFNTRKATEEGRFDKFLLNCEKTLKYKDLVSSK